MLGGSVIAVRLPEYKFGCPNYKTFADKNTDISFLHICLHPNLFLPDFAVNSQNVKLIVWKYERN
jgi:hypothetical protein